MQPLLWLLASCLSIPPQSAVLPVKDPLQQAWSQQVKPIGNQYLRFSYQEKRNELEHSAEPWQQTPYESKGCVWVNAQQFRQNDTLYSATRNKTYYAKTQASEQMLLLLEPGEDKLTPVTQQMLAEQLIKGARYSPISLLDYVYRRHIPLDAGRSTTECGCYTTTINQTVVSLFIRRADGLLSHLTTLKADDLLGDVGSTITYRDYQRIGRTLQPSQIDVDKVNGKLHDQIRLSQVQLSPDAPTLIDPPTAYRLQPAVATTPTIQTEQYNDHIYFLNLPHTDDKVMLVEFADFLLVAEAPLSSQNGELIIREARRLAPNKPIRYFVFGHHHPHYLGGLRPFVHKNATILCSAGNEDYVKYLVDAPHRLQPDSLAMAPKNLRLEHVGARKTITDGQCTMEIYHIGSQSAHTNDYLIYYFPDEQLLFQDDLVWIPKTGATSRVSARQAGLHRAIKALGLPVRTIVQSWPVADAGVKTVIPFAELEASVERK